MVSKSNPAPKLSYKYYTELIWVVTLVTSKTASIGVYVYKVQRKVDSDGKLWQQMLEELVEEVMDAKDQGQ